MPDMNDIPTVDEPLLSPEHRKRLDRLRAEVEALKLEQSAIPDDPYPDGPYRPKHWPAWARDEIFTHVDVHFGWTDRLLILMGRVVTVKVQVIVERPPGRCASQSSAWTHRIRWPWARSSGGYSPVPPVAPTSLACPSCGLDGVEVTAPDDAQRVFIHGATSVAGSQICGTGEWTVPYG